MSPSGLHQRRDDTLRTLANNAFALSSSCTMSSSSFDFAAWPPALTPEQQAILVQKATTRALATGLLYLPPGYPLETPPPQAAIHAPLSLFPAPFPRESFRLAQDIQSLYNVLYSNITMDTAWLDEIMGAEQGVGRVDDFIGQLWRGWKAMRDSGKISQVSKMAVLRYILTEHDRSLCT